MKSLDLSVLGQMPGGQSRLAYLQEAWTEALQALAAIGGSAGLGATPVILNGMVVSGGGNTVTDGWFFYNGELIKFTGGTVSPVGMDVALVLITNSASPLTYNDTSVHNVILETTASLISGPTVTDATHFPVSALTPWVAIDPTLYNDITTINTAIALINTRVMDAWVNGGTPTISVSSGGGTFAGGTWAHNRYKYYPHRFEWQFDLQTWTVTGTVDGLIIQTPAAFFGSGGTWAIPGHITIQFLDLGGSYDIFRGVLADIGGQPYLRLTLPSGAIPPGVVDIHVTLIGETT